MQQLKIGFIGGGNMAEALIAGLTRAGHPAERIFVTDLQSARLDHLQESYGIQAENDAAAVAGMADVLVLAVKPQHMQQAVSDVAEHIKTTATLVSIAAGVAVDSIRQWLKAPVCVVRVMPNTPCLLGCGMAVLYADANVAQSHRQNAEYVLAATGETSWVGDEQQMHAVTAISGSGPAYFFLLAEIMQGTAEALGLDAALAAKLVRQTALGAGRMMVESGIDVATLRQQVTSPGGTTHAALDCMHDCGLTDSVRRGIQAAAQRSKELG
ncbi:MAG: pyrroline-5-carboxylate reductase [Mariprofundaceae bacterium]